MERVNVTITGVSPLLMHSAAGVDPTHPLKKESKAITSKGAKKRTDDDEEELLRLDFALSLYSNESGPFIPETCILGTIRDGARRTRRGKDVLAGVMVEPEEPKLIYNGPRDAKKLFDSSAHRDVRPVGMQGKRITRCRPRFNDWALDFQLVFDPKTISEDTLKVSLEEAGRYCGLCDFRPRFGRFEVTSWKH